MSPARSAAPARVPPDGLPGLDRRWSRLVPVAGAEGAVVWHVLDNASSLDAEPVGTVLAVHGNPTWSYLWRSLLAAGAAGDGRGRPWRVVAVDQLGMGWSERTTTELRLADRVRALGALTDALGLTGPVVTAGHDWGGAVSLGWAVDHPELLAGVVLLNTAVHPVGEAAPAVLRPVMAPGVRDAMTVRSTGFLDTTLSLARPRLAPDVRAAYRAPYESADRRVGIGDFVADIPVAEGHPSRAELDRVAEGVRGLRVPTLLAWGAQDPVFSDRHLRDLQDRVPHADVHRYPRAGHLVIEDEDVAAGVVAWLGARVAPPPARALAEEPDAVPPADEGRPSRADGFRPLGATLVERADDPGTALVELRPAGRRAVSWRALARRTEELARGLRALGVRPGDRVAVLVPPGADLTAVLYACLRLGAVVVLADAGLGVRALSRAVRAAGPVAVVGIERALVAARAMGWAPLLVAAGPTHRRLRRSLDVTATLPEVADLGRAVTEAPAWPGPDDDAAVLFTSGSTGPAKGVVYTHRRLAAMRDAVADAYGMGPDRSFVAAFAPFALLGPALGATSASPDMDVTAPRTLTARALAEAVAAVDGAVVFASPAALAGVVATQGGLRPDDRRALAGVATVLSAGAPVPLRLLEQVQALVPAAALHTPYGMTEMLPVTDVSLTELRRAGAGPGVCVGTPVRGVRVAVSPLDADGRATGAPVAEPGVLGEILVAGPHRKDRYDRLWFTEHASSEAGMHRTGDVGRLDEEGRLWVEGRLAHVVVTDHGVLTPVAPEARVDALDGVTRSAVVGVGPRGTQQVVVVVEPATPTTGPLAPPELAARVRAALDAPVAAVLVVAALPTDLRHNSKIDRGRLAAWAAAVLAGRRARL